MELGRLADDEQGVQEILEGELTKVDKAVKFLSEPGMHMLAPSIGNIHGRQSDPKSNFCWICCSSFTRTSDLKARLAPIRSCMAPMTSQTIYSRHA